MLASARPYGSVLVAGSPVKLKGAVLLQAPGQWPYWAQFWRDWDWATISRTIDAAAALGVNCLQFTATGLADAGITHPDAATMQARLRQLSAYAQARRMVLNPQLGYQPAHTFAGGVAAGTAAAVQMAKLFAQLPNVAFIDAMNEVNLYPATGWSSPSGQALSDMTAFVAAIRQVTSAIPVTVSVGAVAPADIASTWTQAFAPISDFHNIHTYHYQQSAIAAPSLADFAALRSASWYRGRFVVGETGMQGARGSAAQAAWLAGNAALAAAPDCLGSILWGATETSAAPGRGENVSGYGLLDPAGTSLRPGLSGPLAAWPGVL